MSATPLCGIMLGHNAFFGVDHLSAARGAERAAAFSDPKRIMATVEEARSNGAGGMMMSTHERAGPIAQLIAADPRLAQDLKVYPLLPYAQKYVTRSNEVGMVNVVLEMLTDTSMGGMLSLFVNGAKAVMAKDVNAVLSAMMQVELKPFSKLNVPAVFLHDAFTDLALGFGMKEVFEFYMAEVEKNHGATGAFATKNLPIFLERFREWGLPRPVVMTHFNKVGYHMNPDREACEKAAAAHDVSILAMGSLASGFLKPDEAYSYLGGVGNIDGVVVGASSPAHIRETFGAIKANMPKLAV
jgi:hypothetical protein